MADEIKSVVKVEEVNPDDTMLTPLVLLDKAISLNADVEKLERLMALQERWDKRQAEKEYVMAMARFQSQCPSVIKSKEGGQTKDGSGGYKYAPIDKILEAKNDEGKKIKELIAENGFAYDINTPEITDKGVKVVMTISHKSGHSKTFELFMPYAEQTRLMNQPQVVGATSTYGKRYIFCNAFGIMTGDEDTDAVTDDLVEQLNDLIKDWKFKNDYINVIITQINSKRIMNEFIADLPSKEQTARFNELLTLIDESKHRRLWIDFQKQRRTTADKWLDNLSVSKLIKTKE